MRSVLVFLTLAIALSFAFQCYSGTKKEEGKTDCSASVCYKSSAKSGSEKAVAYGCDSAGLCKTAGVAAGKCDGAKDGGNEVNLCCCDKDLCNGSTAKGFISVLFVAFFSYSFF